MGSEVVKAARAAPVDTGGEITLTSGVRARIRPVSSSLLDRVAGAVVDPEVPRQFIEDKGREEPNPLDPHYQKAMREASHLRGVRTTEALVMFGVELLDEVPPLQDWLPRLRLLEKRGVLDLAEFDLDDPLEQEFVWKVFVGVTAKDLLSVTKASGLLEGEIAQAMTSFQGDDKRPAHRAGADKEAGPPRDKVRRAV